MKSRIDFARLPETQFKDTYHIAYKWKQPTIYQGYSIITSYVYSLKNYIDTNKCNIYHIKTNNRVKI